MFPEELAEEEVPHTDAARAFLVRSGGAALRFSLPQRYPLQLPLLSLSCPSAGPEPVAAASRTLEAAASEAAGEECCTGLVQTFLELVAAGAQISPRFRRDFAMI